jgi:serine protease Do
MYYILILSFTFSEVHFYFAQKCIGDILLVTLNYGAVTVKRVFTLFFILFSLPLLTQKAIATEPYSFSPIVKKASPAVVGISVSQKENNLKKKLGDFDDPYGIIKKFLEEYGRQFDNNGSQGKNKMASGSGFMVSEDGYIITNNHVIDGADEINVTINGDDSDSYKAKLIGKDPKTDIAVLKINANKKLPYLEFGDSSKSEVGDQVLVIGNPFELSGSVSTGIISATGRNINGVLDNFIQTDAAINLGNSGGPMLNLNAEVIGVNSIILSLSRGSMGIGFAIPSNTVKKVFEQIKEKGKVIRGRIGVTIQNLDKDMAADLGFKGVTRGALISGVLDDSPAKRAGIKVGDIIIKFNDIEIKNSIQLPKLVAETEIGKECTLELLRNKQSQPIKLKILIEASKDDELNIDENDDDSEIEETIFGMKLKPLDDELRKKFSINNSVKDGLVVVNIVAGSISNMAGIEIGDIIISINDKNISSSQSTKKELEKEIKKNKNNNGATFMINRKGNNFFVRMKSSRSDFD